MAKFPRPLCNSFIVAEHAFLALDKTKTGTIAECGVYDGVTSNILNFYLSGLPGYSRQIACDTFNGFPADGTKQEGYAKGDLKPASREYTIEKLRRAGIVPLVGRVEETLPRIQDARFAFAFLDLDLEAPTLFCAKFFKPRILVGGRIGFHDYVPNDPKYRLAGIEKVVNKLFLNDPAWRKVGRQTAKGEKHDGRFIFFERMS